ncbi:MAG: xanthine dehydrogenase family protein molybdopterin-binding subunit [Pseudonocardia sp.]|nr:xanthine dehydrogenase family protein molybdopterin-binding subunit [Pseudonocardia sp.]
MTELPPTLAANPRLSDWVAFDAGGTVTVRSGKVEIGQGVLTALAQIVAEELDVRPGRVRMVAARTGTSPDEGLTSGSMSMQHSGAALRQVCAEVRAICVRAAAGAWNTPPEEVRVSDGEITGPEGLRTSYWELPGDELLARDASGTVRSKPPEEYRVVGTNMQRLDIPDKVTGRPRFVHDVELPGLVYGRVVRPPSRVSNLSDVDTSAAEALPGVLSIVRDGGFLGVVAEREEIAQKAAERLGDGARWQERESLPDAASLPEFLTGQPSETTVLVDVGDPDGGRVSRTVSASYHRPYLAHASMAPSCAVALATGDEVRVWSNTQGPYLLRRALASALGLHEDRVTVHHVEGAGCYGHNGADDVALDAALLARAVPDRPVKVMWSRRDELGWAPFGPAAVVRLSADLDTASEVLSWRHEIWGNGHVGRPGRGDGSPLLAATHRADPATPTPSMDPPEPSGGASRNAVPPYSFPAHRVVNHRLLTMPLRTSSLRSLGAFVNVFAAESFVDELAQLAGVDPVAYRLRHLDDPRARAVIEAAAERASWGQDPPADSVGRGIGFARYKNAAAYCAVVAEVEATHEVRVRRLTIAVDAGLVINPDGLANQIEGGAIQATSWTLKEQVRFDRRGILSDTWETYPILRFSEVPPVEVRLLDRPHEPSLGAGEAAQGPTAAAIGNALRDALGVRVRRLPLTAENIVAAMDDTPFG